MNHQVWQKLLYLETRDGVFDWHKVLFGGRELNARRVQEITSAAKQAREFFKNASDAHESVKSLLSFYGVASLSRATLLLFKPDSGEASLKPGHGLTAIEWTNTLSGDITHGLKSLEGLRIQTCAGLFSEFIAATENRMCFHVSSSKVDWELPYESPPTPSEITFSDLLNIVPDVNLQTMIPTAKVSFARVHSMQYSDETGFSCKMDTKCFSAFRQKYIDLGYNYSDQDGLSADAASFTIVKPQFMHAYLKKDLGNIPSLYITEPFEGGHRYSQMAVTYMLAYFLGMLTRYFPTQWVGLVNGHKGDSLWPVINLIQQYVDKIFPELISEFIECRLASKT